MESELVLRLHVLPDVEEAPDHVGVADLAAVVPVRLPLQPVPEPDRKFYNNLPYTDIDVSFLLCYT
jgi:hypothetical protein